MRLRPGEIHNCCRHRPSRRFLAGSAPGGWQLAGRACCFRACSVWRVSFLAGSTRRPSCGGGHEGVCWVPYGWLWPSWGCSSIRRPAPYASSARRTPAGDVSLPDWQRRSALVGSSTSAVRVSFSPEMELKKTMLTAISCYSLFCQSHLGQFTLNFKET